MKKIIIFLLAFFAIFSQTNAARYGGARVAKTIGDGATWCPTDGDTTGGTPTFYPGHGFGNYSYDSMVTAESGDNMYCQYWDGQVPANPTVLSLSNVKNSDGSSCSYVGGVYYCKKSGVSMNFNWGGASDAGGSGLNGNGYQYVFQRASDQAWLVSGFSPSGIYVSASSLQEGTYYTWVRSFDNAGNTQGVFTQGPNLVIDTIAPTLSDISDTNPVIGSNLLAVNSKPFSVSVGNGGGSPIVDIDGYFEKFDVPGSYDAVSSNNATLSFTKSIEKVDNNRQANGSRNYNFHLTNVCDAAGNCISGVNIKNYNYSVYANTTNITTKTVSTNTIDDAGNVADGSTKQLTISLFDAYGNAIVPASGILRTIDINFNSVSNSMYLNQYLRSGSKSIYVTKANQGSFSNTLLPGGNTSINGETSTNGNYTYTFKAYTPTANATASTVSDPNAVFSIGSITFDVNGSWSVSGQSVSNSTTLAKFKPLYETTITGDLTNEGLIEGNVQNSNISINKTSGGITSGITAGSQHLYLKFGGGGATYYGLKASGGSLNNSTISETGLSTDYGFTSSSLVSVMTLDNPPAPSSIDSYLSSHISYNIYGVAVTYNSDIVGKSSYFGSNTLQTANQSTIKVVGLTSSSNSIQQIVQGENTQTLGTIEKTDIKTEILKQAYDFAKNVTYNNISDNESITSISASNGGGKRVGNIIYLGSRNPSDGYGNKVYTLGDGVNPLTVDSTKTIVVIGGNLYIKSNMLTSGTNTLGIIVLKDDNGNGGNVYIAPSVKTIVGTIFTEKSLISYNGTSELDGTTNAVVLRNQLYIYGSVFSYNTIGGSAKSLLECPYYVTSCSSKAEAQKYDLNYLRRYYLKDTNGDGIGDTPGYSGTNYFPSTSGYYSYPIVIKYNPDVQTNPPPFFTTTN